ncbi:MAG: hypothetical protein WBW33_10280 [Bryobacteraceae bacterium]
MKRCVQEAGHLIWAARITIVATILVLVSLPLTLGAEHLRPETLQAWNQYVQQVNARMEARLQPGSGFLWIDESPGRQQVVRGGEILVAPVGEHCPKTVANGLIHDWIAAAFLPDTTLADVLTVVRDYDRYPEFYKPYVMKAKPVSKEGEEDRFSMTLLNKSLFQRTALDNDYETTYFRPSPSRIYSVSHSTRVQEIDDLGRPTQHTMPVDTGNGYIWRLYSISRMEERDGGVYVELEAIVLSRDIPGAFRMFVDPIVRRVSKDAMITTLTQTSAAVHSSVESAKRAKPSCATETNVDCAHARKISTESTFTARGAN